MDQNSLTTDEAKEAHIDELLKKLSANQKGLSSSDPEKRLTKYGLNLLKPKKKSDTLTLLITQFKRARRS